jgi:hypothetical protein
MTLNATQELRKVRHLYLRGAVLGTCGLTHGLDPTRHEHKRGRKGLRGLCDPNRDKL